MLRSRGWLGDIKMLNVEKIRLMTQLSIFEKKQGKDIRETSSYYRNDYISRKIVHAVVRYTLCFLLIVVIFVTLQLESILLKMNLDYLREASNTILVLYFAGMGVVMFASYIIYHSKYEKTHQMTLFYQAKLDKLLDIEEGREQKAEGSAGSRSAAWSLPDHKPAAGNEPSFRSVPLPAAEPEDDWLDEAPGREPEDGWLDETPGREPEDGWLDEAPGREPEDGWLDETPGREPENGWLDEDYWPEQQNGKSQGKREGSV